MKKRKIALVLSCFRKVLVEVTMKKITARPMCNYGSQPDDDDLIRFLQPEHDSSMKFTPISLTLLVIFLNERKESFNCFRLLVLWLPSVFRTLTRSLSLSAAHISRRDNVKSFIQFKFISSSHPSNYHRHGAREAFSWINISLSLAFSEYFFKSKVFGSEVIIGTL